MVQGVVLTQQVDAGLKKIYKQRCTALHSADILTIGLYGWSMRQNTTIKRPAATLNFHLLTIDRRSVINNNCN